MSAAGIGGATQIIGGLISAAGQYQAGQIERRISEFNVRQLENEAYRLHQEGNENLSRRRKENLRILGSQKAAVAASGVSMSEGSPLEAIAENAGLLELDALDEQRAIEIEKQRLHTQTRLTSIQGKQASRAATVGAIATAVSSIGGGASQMAGKR